MTTETMNDKLSIKNLLFTRAIPNYVIPNYIRTEGRQLHACTDCGDRFVFKASYEQHINRKSLKITYMCRHCNTILVFVNRCKLLCHIRSHAFKTATINVSDLKVELLPEESTNTVAANTVTANTVTAHTATAHTVTAKDPVKVRNKPLPQTSTSPVEPVNKKKNICFECRENIHQTGVMYKDRASHYMRYTNEMHTCPVCLFVLPTNCGLEAHLRIHLKSCPFYCPECGVYLSNKSIHYPYNHDCQGFKMMRATSRVKCPVKQCNPFHPSQNNIHMQKHLKKVFKCATCIVACFNKDAIEKHLTKHPGHSKANYILFYQCEMCPGRLVVHNQLENHYTKGHSNNFVYPCWQCNINFPQVSALIAHHKESLCKAKPNDKKLPSDPDRRDVLYRVLKRCDSCKVYFTYRCKYDEINQLPNECPYKCSPGELVKEVSRAEHTTLETFDQLRQIICHLCKMRIPVEWEDIKAHYAIHHSNIKCLDLQVDLQQLDVSDYTKKKVKRIGPVKKKGKPRSHAKEKTLPTEDSIEFQISNEKDNASLNGEYRCSKCIEQFESKNLLEEHILIHRDPCTAYQCLECGECFVVKPSFSTHLLIEHGISDVEEYVKGKNCYNESALLTHQNEPENNEPLREHQCNICRNQFDNQDDLEKHYRVHGMAFLMKKTMNKNSP